MRHEQPNAEKRRTDPGTRSQPETSDRFISKLVNSHQSGHSLAGAFYNDERIYREEIDRIWRHGWLFVGHSCEVQSPGDYFTFSLDGDSLIVLRDDEGDVKAMWNVCRHRGTQICDQPSGRVGRFVCPYHQWTYARDGALISCRGMHEDFDKSQWGLHPAQVRETAGLIFVSLAEEPPSFAEADALIGTMASPQGLDRARVAKSIDYEVAANWKLVWENNRECYHCNANHPQYIKANFDHYNADDTNAQVQSQIDAAVARSEEKWAAAGLAVSHRKSGMTLFPDAERNIWYSANRTPLVDGWVSETMDGKQVAPLMGDYSEADVGTVRIRTMPNLWNHSSCDHGVSTRLLPNGPKQTLIRVTWLVDADAVEGEDYQLDDLLPFWQLTSEQDWELCERAQRGVDSTRYAPGPFSKHKEYNVEGFVQWYLHQLVSA
ncbi:aromatic ring-hydroxylating dioxygenase subunit alpha [Pirellulales bacterium]|nr:aromatic ring-hydroxylating dioxygenase subunit alpha [Pirellulales bacterium]